MSLLKQCDVADINSLNYHPYATCCGKCEKFEREKPYQARLLAQHIADAKQSEIEYRKKNMKQFNAVKKVIAKPMTRQEYNDLRGWNVSTSAKDEEGYLIVDPEIEANTLSYHGEVSWVSKENFERHYYKSNDQRVGEMCTAPQDPDHELTEDEVATLASGGSLCNCCEFVQVGGDCPIEKGDEFDFGSAIYLMQKSKSVMRKGWNGKGMYLFIIQGSNDIAKLHGYGFGELLGEPTFSDAIFLKTVDNRLVPWTISQSDALATDWCLA